MDELTEDSWWSVVMVGRGWVRGRVGHNLILILYKMLSVVLRRCCSIPKIRCAFSNAKEIYERTRKLYETQSIAPSKVQDNAKTDLLRMQERTRKFQELLLEVGR